MADATANSIFIDSSTLIPGPSFHVDLSAFDACHPVHYSRRLLIFRCSSAAQRDRQLAALKTGLQALVLRCPILGGTVVPLPVEAVSSDNDLPDWRTIVPGADPGIELIVKDLRTTIASFKELEATEFPPLSLPYNLLVPVPSNLGNDRPFAAFKMQFSAIEGGAILTFAMSHSVADGVGMNELMRVLSEETRRAQEHPNEVRPMVVPANMQLGQDRSLLRNMTSKMAFNIKDHPAYMWKTSQQKRINLHHFETASPEFPVLLRISPTGLAQLKADSTLPGAPPISTHDAICALIWRTVLLIRSRRSTLTHDVLDSTMGSIFLPSDARRHIHLPPSYIGNAVYQLTAELDLGTLLSPSGLQFAASAVRRAITAVKGAIVESYLTMLKEKWVDWGFLGSYSTTGVAFGTDWSSGLLYSQDWGDAFGPLVRYRHPGEASIFILPKLPNGGAELVVSCTPEEVEVLEGSEGFKKYIQ